MFYTNCYLTGKNLVFTDVNSRCKCCIVLSVPLFDYIFLVLVCAVSGVALIHLHWWEDSNKTEAAMQCFLATFPVSHPTQALLLCCSRASKAFSNQQTMQQCGCERVFLELLQLFVGAVSVPVHRALVQGGVRQYLHRMVVCMVPTLTDILSNHLKLYLVRRNREIM